LATDYVALNAAKVYDVDAFTEHRYAQFARHLSNASRILDAGCGRGDGGAVLRRTNPSAHIEGLELVTARIALIPAGIYNAVTVGDLATMETQSRFDAVVMGELIEHVPFTALEQLIASAATLLRPGGRLLLTTPNPHYLFLRWRGESILGGAHVSAHCPAVLSELLNHRGFRVTRVEGSGRVSRVIGVRFPLPVYGSYMIVAQRREHANKT
jgi:2-polyprenyl-3-methyl-5-hydroxy-6-metoxy-1,4-benzoquinol methylase